MGNKTFLKSQFNLKTLKSKSNSSCRAFWVLPCLPEQMIDSPGHILADALVPHLVTKFSIDLSNSQNSGQRNLLNKHN